MTAITTRPEAARGRRKAVDPAMAIALAIGVAFVLIAILYPIVSMVGTSLTDEALPVF